MLLTLCLGGKEICPSFWLAVKEESQMESVGTPEGLDHRIQGPLPFPGNGLTQYGVNCGHCWSFFCCCCCCCCCKYLDMITNNTSVFSLSSPCPECEAPWTEGDVAFCLEGTHLSLAMRMGSVAHATDPKFTLTSTQSYSQLPLCSDKETGSEKVRDLSLATHSIGCHLGTSSNFQI